MIKSSNEKITAVVTALNEEATVGEVLKVLLDSKYFDQVILVDDGSTDKTAEVGRKLGAKVVKLEKVGGSGKGNAMQQGVNSTDAGIIAFFDADIIGLSKEHISCLVDPMLKGGIEMCVGVRSRLLGLPALLVKIDPLTAIGGERVVKKDLFNKIPAKFLQGFATETILDYYCLAKKIPIKYVVLENLDMITKEKKLGLKKGFAARIKMVFEIIKIRINLILNGNEFIQKNNTR